MELKDWADLARIVTSFASLAVLCFTAYIAWSVKKWQVDAAKSNMSSQTTEHMRQYNMLVLSDPDLQDFEAKMHPHDDLNRSDVKKMYQYFILLNVQHSRFVSNNSKIIDEHFYIESIKNTSRMTYTDREFIENNCLKRGYPESFANELRGEWKKIGLLNNSSQQDAQKTRASA